MANCKPTFDSMHASDRAPYYDCVCDRLGNFDTCKASLHFCSCDKVGPIRCRLEDGGLHKCSCNSTFGPNGCKRQNEYPHHCSCRQFSSSTCKASVHVAPVQRQCVKCKQRGRCICPDDGPEKCSWIGWHTCSCVKFSSSTCKADSMKHSCICNIHGRGSCKSKTHLM